MTSRWLRLFFVLVCVTVPSLHAQAPAWLWARAGGGETATDYCRGAACDATGATFVTGDFYGPDCVIGGQTFSSASIAADAYVIRYLSDGTPDWVRVIGGAGSEVGVDIDTDSAGAAILAGTSGTPTLNCGTNPAGQTVTLTQPTGGGRGVLLVKFDSLGRTLWARGFNGIGAAAGNEVATGPNDEVLVIGPYAQNGGSTLTFPDNSTITSAGGDQDVFVAKFSAAGDFQWGFGLAGGGHEEGRGISADAAGNVLICGQFDGSLTLGTDTHPSTGSDDIFVAKYDASGAFQWSRAFGGTGADAGRGIDPAPDGGVYVSGEFTGSVTFDSFTLTAAGTTKDIFLLKLSAEGAVEWVTSFGSALGDVGCEIESDQAGNIYCAGSAFSGLSLPGGATLASAGNRDQFVAKFSPAGQLVWAVNGGGAGADTNFAIGLDPAGRVTVAGTYSVTATYGAHTITAPGTSTDFFIARLDAGGAQAPLVADFTADITSGHVPLTVAFSDQSTGGPTAWEWDFDNNSSVDSTEQNPSFTFSRVGTYSVQLTVRRAGAAESLVRTLYIDVINPNEATLFPKQTMNFAGQERSYNLHLPPGYTGAMPVPLVLDLHGGGGRGDFIAEDHGWLPLSDQHGFIVAFPNGGSLFGPYGGYDWNNYWQDAAPDDAAFLAALIKHLCASYNIDDTRIYVTGHSDGAAMCNTFAIFHGDLLAAAAPVNGNWLTTFGLPESLLAPAAPIPVWTWRGETEAQPTGLETRDVQDARQKAWWMGTLGAGPVQAPVASSDGTYSYLDEIYPNGTAEYRFTVEIGQNHAYRPQYATRIWNEFFSRKTRNPASRIPAPVQARTIPLGLAKVTFPAAANKPWHFYSWTAAPDGSLVTMESSPDLATWTSFATAKVEGSHRALFMCDHGTGAQPTRFFYRAQVRPAPALTPLKLDILAGATQTFTITNGVAVNWAVVEPGGGSITAGGFYTAPAVARSYHVRAIAQSNAELIAEAKVNVVTASPEELARFTAAADYSESVDGDALLIMKSGAIVFERYTGTTTANSQHQLASGTKSFSAALFALGEADGLWTLDENVAQTITEWQGVANKSQITIRQLISLTSGLLDSPLYQAINAANLDTYDLAINDSSTPQPPGVACIYAPSNFQVLAVMFERKTGGLDPAQYLYDRLLSRLGFTAAHLNLWTRDIMGKPQMAGGARFTARAWANYGKLWIQNGQWEDQTILDPQTMNLASTYANPAFLGYGFTWWLNVPNQGTYTPGVDDLPTDGIGDGTQIATNAPADLFMAAGTGKQRLYVIPSLDLVIVRFGHGLGSSFTDHALLGHILGTP